MTKVITVKAAAEAAASSGEDQLEIFIEFPQPIDPGAHLRIPGWTRTWFKKIKKTSKLFRGMHLHLNLSTGPKSPTGSERLQKLERACSKHSIRSKKGFAKPVNANVFSFRWTKYCIPQLHCSRLDQRQSPLSRRKWRHFE